MKSYRSVAQPGRASDLGSEGHRFKSGYSDKNAIAGSPAKLRWKSTEMLEIS